MSENKAQVLTRDHVRFVRKDADKVVFRYMNGQATMEVTNKAGAVLTLDCAFSYRGYGNAEYGYPEREPRKAFCMIHTPGFTQEWITVASLLRAGDELELEFIADSNGYAKAAKSDGGPDILPAFDGLHMDYMRLVVRRGKTKLTFMLCSSVCPNNSARMFSWE